MVYKRFNKRSFRRRKRRRRSTFSSTQKRQIIGYVKKMAKRATAKAKYASAQKHIVHTLDTGQVANGIVVVAAGPPKTGPKIPHPGRTMTFGNWYLGNVAAMTADLQDMGHASNLGHGEKATWRNFKEEWKMINNQAFTIYITAYEYFFTDDVDRIDGLSAEYTTAAAERALFNTTLPDDNMVAGMDMSALPLVTLYKYNLYHGTTLANSIGDSYRSYVDATNFGKGATDNKYVCLNRHVFHTKFTPKQMHEVMVCKKKRIVTLQPGESFDYTYYRKTFHLDGGDASGGTVKEKALKGGGGVMFHCVGSLIHEENTDENNEVTNEVTRSSICLDVEHKRYAIVTIQQSDISGNQYNEFKDFNYSVFTDGEQMNLDYTEQDKTGT